MKEKEAQWMEVITIGKNIINVRIVEQNIILKMERTNYR